jgi:hypothetical protein
LERADLALDAETNCTEVALHNFYFAIKELVFVTFEYEIFQKMKILTNKEES